MMFGAASTPSSNPFAFGSKSASNGMSNQPAAGFGGASSTGGFFGQKASSSSAFSSSGTGGLFGSNSVKPVASSGIFGTTNSAPQNTTGGGLFGSNHAMCTQNNASKVFFGNASNTPNTQQNSAAGNMFGGASSGLGNTNTTNNPGGLFGSSTNNAPNSGGLFGSKPAAPASGHSRGLLGSSSNPGGTGGIFGNKTNNTDTAGLLGGTKTTDTPGDIFGGGQKSTPTSMGLFGGLSNTSGSLFGGSKQQPHQPQLQPQQIQLTSMTRFSDLSPELKNELQQLDMYIEKQQLIAGTLDADIHKHDDLVRSIPRDIEYLRTRVCSIKSALRHDSDQLQALKSVNDELTEDIRNIMHLILQLATPGTKLSSSFHINEYFVKRIKKYRVLLTSYEKIIRECLNATSGLETTCNESSASIHNVVEIVKNQYSVFMELCEVVAQLHGEVDRLGIKNAAC